MPSFEEEAFNRARQMHRRPAEKPTVEKQTRTQQNAAKSADAPQIEEQAPAPAAETAKERRSEGLLDVMFKNREQSLILLLLVLLTEENAEPSVLLALMYLLI